VPLPRVPVLLAVILSLLLLEPLQELHRLQVKLINLALQPLHHQLLAPEPQLQDLVHLLLKLMKVVI
jgi:hypothetical protein